jgi:hypothetical protein
LTLAEHAGEASPDGMQHLLADPDAVLVVDETGDLNKGTARVGVQRQYTDTAGRTENARVTVWLTHATPAGHGLIDRALYLPRLRHCGLEGVAAAQPARSFRTGSILATFLDAVTTVGGPAPWPQPARPSVVLDHSAELSWILILAS